MHGQVSRQACRIDRMPISLGFTVLQKLRNEILPPFLRSCYTIYIPTVERPRKYKITSKMHSYSTQTGLDSKTRKESLGYIILCFNVQWCSITSSVLYPDYGCSHVCTIFMYTTRLVCCCKRTQRIGEEPISKITIFFFQDASHHLMEKGRGFEESHQKLLSRSNFL